MSPALTRRCRPACFPTPTAALIRELITPDADLAIPTSASTTEITMLPTTRIPTLPPTRVTTATAAIATARAPVDTLSLKRSIEVHLGPSAKIHALGQQT